MSLDAERERLRLATAGMPTHMSLVFRDHEALIDAQAAALASKEAEVIERCAKVCDALESEFIKKDAELGDEDDARWVYMATGVRASIKAIRAPGKGS